MSLYLSNLPFTCQVNYISTLCLPQILLLSWRKRTNSIKIIMGHKTSNRRFMLKTFWHVTYGKVQVYIIKWQHVLIPGFQLRMLCHSPWRLIHIKLCFSVCDAQSLLFAICGWHTRLLWLSLGKKSTWLGWGKHWWCLVSNSTRTLVCWVKVWDPQLDPDLHPSWDVLPDYEQSFISFIFWKQQINQK